LLTDSVALLVETGFNYNTATDFRQYLCEVSFHTKSHSNTVILFHFNKLNSVALVRERTIPTERPPPVGEVSANFCG